MAKLSFLRTATFTDKASGKDVQRPALEELCAFVRHGDTVVVHSMDRLAATSTISGAPFRN